MGVNNENVGIDFCMWHRSTQLFSFSQQNKYVIVFLSFNVV